MARVNQPDARGSGTPVRLYRADAVRDGAGLRAEPGAVAMVGRRDGAGHGTDPTGGGGRVLAAGDPDAVRAAVVAETGTNPDVTELPGHLLLPGLVNAHAHLDLTELGARPFEGDFVEWARMVIAERPKDAAAVQQAVEAGARRSRAAGVLTIGDISPEPAAIPALRASGMRGVGFAEVLGIDLGGPRIREMFSWIRRTAGWWRSPDEAAGVVTGLSAHAPYSTGPMLYASLGRTNLGPSGTPVCTHLAETEAELEFVASGTGPFRQLLQEMGKWDDRYAAEIYGRGEHPVDWLGRIADEANEPAEDGPVEPDGLAMDEHQTGAAGPHWLCAHCNYVEDRHIRTLADRGWSVAYCPRASDYFGHRGHRYLDMLAAGVNVCLGTDSIVCHGTLSMLDEMRHLHQRDGTDPELLLAMATWRGMRGLGLDQRNATLSRGATPGLIAVDRRSLSGGHHADPLAAILATDDPPPIRVLEEPGAAP